MSISLSFQLHFTFEMYFTLNATRQKNEASLGCLGAIADAKCRQPDRIPESDRASKCVNEKVMKEAIPLIKLTGDGFFHLDSIANFTVLRIDESLFGTTR